MWRAYNYLFETEKEGTNEGSTGVNGASCAGELHTTNVLVASSASISAQTTNSYVSDIPNECNSNRKVRIRGRVTPKKRARLLERRKVDGSVNMLSRTIFLEVLEAITMYEQTRATCIDYMRLCLVEDNLDNLIHLVKLNVEGERVKMQLLQDIQALKTFISYSLPHYLNGKRKESHVDGCVHDFKFGLTRYDQRCNSSSSGCMSDDDQRNLKCDFYIRPFQVIRNVLNAVGVGVETVVDVIPDTKLKIELYYCYLIRAAVQENRITEFFETVAAMEAETGGYLSLTIR